MSYRFSVTRVSYLCIFCRAARSWRERDEAIRYEPARGHGHREGDNLIILRIVVGDRNPKKRYKVDTYVYFPRGSSAHRRPNSYKSNIIE
jgi:hypothetical protein